MKTHKIGIIGIGMISEFHAKALAEIPNAELVAAHSRSLEKAEKFTAEFGGKAYDSIDEFMADPEIEIVSICTPSGAHAETAIAAAKAGKHVICEKPIEISLERIDAMTQAHADAGTKLCGIFPYRFNEVTNEMKRAVDAGRFGKITFAAAHVPWWRDQKYYDEGGWKGTQQLDGGGALMNQSIHAVDSLIWLMGDVDSIMAYTDCLAHDNIEVEDTAVACLRFKNGALGLISGTTSIYPGHFRRVEICGNEGTAICVEEDLTHWDFLNAHDDDDAIRDKYAAVTQTGGGASDPSAISFEGHRRNFVAFMESIDSDSPAPIDGKEARRAVEVILAIYESAKTGQLIKL